MKYALKYELNCMIMESLLGWIEMDDWLSKLIAIKHDPYLFLNN